MDQVLLDTSSICCILGVKHSTVVEARLTAQTFITKTLATSPMRSLQSHKYATSLAELYSSNLFWRKKRDHYPVLLCVSIEKNADLTSKPPLHQLINWGVCVPMSESFNSGNQLIK